MAAAVQTSAPDRGAGRGMARRHRQNPFGTSLSEDAVAIGVVVLAAWWLLPGLWSKLTGAVGAAGRAIGQGSQGTVAAHTVTDPATGQAVVVPYFIPNYTSAGPGNATPGYTINGDGSVTGPDGTLVEDPSFFLATVNPSDYTLQDTFGKPLLDAGGHKIFPGWAQELPAIGP